MTEDEFINGRSGGSEPKGILNPGKTRSMETIVIDPHAPRPTAVERTKVAMIRMTEGRKNQARAFFNRVEKRRKQRKIEKATRRKMRRK